MSIKKKQAENTKWIANLLRITFLIFIALIIVYIYYLNTKGELLNTFMFVTAYTSRTIKRFLLRYPLIIIAICSYIAVFFGGYVIGKKKRKK